MKKWTYLISGVIIGAVVTTAGSAFADQVKSLIGKKVTGEYVVVVNGKTLTDKGAVIDGRTNVPVRGVADAIGADIKVKDKKIIVTTEETQPGNTSTSSNQQTSSGNKYMGGSKENLQELKRSIELNQIKPAEEGRKVILADIETLKNLGGGEALKKKEEILKEYEDIIANASEELQLVEEALAAIK